MCNKTLTWKKFQQQFKREICRSEYSRTVIEEKGGDRIEDWCKMYGVGQGVEVVGWLPATLSNKRDFLSWSGGERGRGWPNAIKTSIKAFQPCLHLLLPFLEATFNNKVGLDYWLAIRNTSGRGKGLAAVAVRNWSRLAIMAKHERTHDQSATRWQILFSPSHNLVAEGGKLSEE